MWGARQAPHLLAPTPCPCVLTLAIVCFTGMPASIGMSIARALRTLAGIVFAALEAPFEVYLTTT